jgi:hypothetical protein
VITVAIFLLIIYAAFNWSWIKNIVTDMMNVLLGNSLVNTFP